MLKLPADTLNRLRPLPLALIELKRKLGTMQHNHSERGTLAGMIQNLEAEIDLHGKGYL